VDSGDRDITCMWWMQNLPWSPAHGPSGSFCMIVGGFRGLPVERDVVKTPANTGPVSDVFGAAPARFKPHRILPGICEPQRPVDLAGAAGAA
jgi:hypothetical protein